MHNQIIQHNSILVISDKQALPDVQCRVFRVTDILEDAYGIAV